MPETKERPEFLTEEHLDFLYNLRASGKINMFGAAPVLQQAFPDELTMPQARKVHVWWMENFDQERGENASAMFSSQDDSDDEDDDEDDFLDDEDLDEDED